MKTVRDLYSIPEPKFKLFKKACERRGLFRSTLITILIDHWLLDNEIVDDTGAKKSNVQRKNAQRRWNRLEIDKN